MTVIRASDDVARFIEQDILRSQEMRNRAAGKHPETTDVIRADTEAESAVSWTGPYYKAPNAEWYRRLWRWFVARIILGANTAIVRPWVYKHCAPCQWFVEWIPKFATFVWTVIGPRVPPYVHAKRMSICADCRMRTLVIQRPTAQDIKTQEPRFKEYCGGCGCPKWRMSELRTKNRFARWQCPRKLHPDPARDIYQHLLDTQQKLISKMNKATAKAEGKRNPGGGCKGCGNGSR